MSGGDLTLGARRSPHGDDGRDRFDGTLPEMKDSARPINQGQLAWLNIGWVVVLAALVLTLPVLGSDHLVGHSKLHHTLLVLGSGHSKLHPFLPC